MNQVLKEIYENVCEYSAYYTGGNIQWTNDGKYFTCQCDDTIEVVEISNGSKTLTIGKAENYEESDHLYTFQLSKNNDMIITAHKSGLIKLWDRHTGKQIRVWRSGHKGPVALLKFDSTDLNVASGGADGNVRLWDLEHYTCTSSLKGATGVFSVLEFHPDTNKHLIFGAADDTRIRSWNSKTGKEHLVYSGHFSKITSIQFTHCGNMMVSAGRDKVLILWNLNHSKAIKTLPVYESIEAMILLPQAFIIPNFKKKIETEGVYVACAGEKGKIKVWNVQASKLMYEQAETQVSPASEEGGLSITHLLLNNACDMIAVVTVDHNIIIHTLETLSCTKQLIGFSDEILDVIFLGQDETHIVVATNSCDLKYYNLEDMNCHLIKGHTDIVMSLATFPTRPDIFVSSGKDNTVRLWLQDSNKAVSCVGVGSRHTASVGSVFASQISADFFVSVSQDKCLKVWSVPEELEKGNAIIKSKITEIAHQMDINCVAVSPNDKMIVTGSQDKTAKIWTESLSLLGVLKGHRRGVWCTRFSPVDQVILTSSADSSIKLWSIADLSCLKTFEGHESSVIKVEFLSKGQQIISAGGDGLIKLWNIKSSECKCTLDIHDGKVWSLAINKAESLIISGGSDSKLVKMKDVTMERREQQAKDREEMILQEQELQNYLHNKQLIKALKLAIRMERPLKVLKIVNEVLKSGNENLSETIKEINHTQKESLLKFAVEWNTNSKHCQAAQLVFSVLLPEILSGELKVPDLPKLIESALPYSERHLERLTHLLQDLNFITYTVNCMQPHGVD